VRQMTKSSRYFWLLPRVSSRARTLSSGSRSGPSTNRNPLHRRPMSFLAGVVGHPAEPAVPEKPPIAWKRLKPPLVGRWPQGSACTRVAWLGGCGASARARAARARTPWRTSLGMLRDAAAGDPPRERLCGRWPRGLARGRAAPAWTGQRPRRLRARAPPTGRLADRRGAHDAPPAGAASATPGHPRGRGGVPAPATSSSACRWGIDSGPCRPPRGGSGRWRPSSW
jgi:hypothetical protein